MELKVYSVFDIKAESYLQPMFFRTSAEALRSFSAAAEDSSHQFHKHAEDFVLFELGVFDDDSGKVVPYTAPISLSTASDASSKHRKYYAERLLQSPVGA